MSCNTCNKVKKVSLGQSGLNYTLDLEAAPITDRFGKIVDLSQAIAKRPHSPVGGWGVSFYVNSVKTDFSGLTPDSVYREVAKVFDLNGVDYTHADLWLNLNIQWLQRVADRYRRISMTQLLSVALPVTHERTADPHSKVREFPVSEQIVAWSFLSIYLQNPQSSYGFSRFITLAETLKDLYNPQKSPFQNTSAAFQKIVLNIEALSKNPAYTVEAARQWLWETLVDLGLTGVTFNEYAKRANWL
jgi:hypothetical protein